MIIRMALVIPRGAARLGRADRDRFACTGGSDSPVIHGDTSGCTMDMHVSINTAREV